MSYSALFSIELSGTLNQIVPGFPKQPGSEKSRNLNAGKYPDLKTRMEESKEIQEKDLTLEDELQEEVPENPAVNKDNASRPITWSYSFHQEQFFAGQADNPAVDYLKLWYGEHPQANAYFRSEPEYAVENSSVPAVEGVILTSEEAKETIREIQYAALLGSAANISFENRRQLNQWILFHKIEFGLEQSKALTQNVNYGPLL